MRWSQPELEDVRCDLCLSGPDKHELVLHRGDGLRIVECQSCGLSFVNPRPSSEQVAALYDGRYFDRGGLGGVGYDESELDAPAARLLRHRQMQERLRIAIQHSPLQGRRFLEIGSADGELVSLASRAGAVATGVDISAEIVNRARARFPEASFECATVHDIAERNLKFDIICCFEVIEHVLSPRLFLRALRELCNPGAIVVISTPNYAHGAFVGRDRWLGFRRSFEHLYFLTPTTLTALAAISGFEVEEWYGMGWGGVAGAARAKTQLREALRSIRVLRFVSLVRAYLAPSPRYTRKAPLHSLLAVLRVQ
jgi:SAM-dependent methyltransferase